MSRGVGHLQLALLNLIGTSPAGLGLHDLGRGLFGENRVVRARGRRRFTVAVPAGDLSNIRRALKSLVRRGLVVPAVAGPAQKTARRARRFVRYLLSDRFTCDSAAAPAAPAAPAEPGARRPPRSPPSIAPSCGPAMPAHSPEDPARMPLPRCAAGEERA
jgi:hypothetical protein